MLNKVKATTRPRPEPPGKQPKKMGNIITIKLNLDTTELDNKLNRLEDQLERIKSLEDTLKFSKDFNEVKNITINNNADIKDIMKRCVEAAISMESLK
ncbi:hypothetical protein FDG46_17260 [Clostridium botulinum]|jgi:hypothetical protein|uniref:Uncharacterized protein n=1 Tax=Clostridium botulinum TaxID=1491 RepID=A0ABD7CLC4_CLOBO|nr:hypothetical protein [Clostridium botulinum]ABS35242.1 conserved domain protein [Clostridium botulinum A str. ATCC 19397]KGO12706.1 hypothetical protein NZ45_16330 [Clostridium botulinum]MBO3438456.1 hypothetical protein [Clostridium botulinum]NFH87846.1 hypothetical protein [Clostridium botulinum]NFJ77465.1 hypothetical protein [Clostridium botulinum]